MWQKAKEWLWDVKFHFYGFEIPLLYMIMIVFLIVGYQVIQSKVNENQWKTLESEELGYKIDYPAGWSVETFWEGYENKHRGLPKGIRAFFNYEFFLPINRKTAAIYWLPLADLEEAIEWGNEILEPDRKGAILQKNRVGIGQYPALMRNYSTERGERRVVYISTNSGVFILKFYARNYDEKVEVIFKHMLASFEITF